MDQLRINGYQLKEARVRSEAWAKGLACVGHRLELSTGVVVGFCYHKAADLCVVFIVSAWSPTKQPELLQLRMASRISDATFRGLHLRIARRVHLGPVIQEVSVQAVSE